MLVLKAEKTAPCGTVFDDRRDPDPHQLALVTAAAESIPGLAHLKKKVRPLRSAPCGWNKNQDNYGVVTTLTVAPLIWVNFISVPSNHDLKTRAVDAADSSPQYITQDVSLVMLAPS